MKKILLLICLCSMLFHSCLYKSVMKDSPDGVVYSTLYEKSNTIYLLLVESVFQASSKEYNGSSYNVRGHNDFRISVYDASTGILLNRRKLKGSNRSPLIGIGGGQFWLYTEKAGLYSIDLITLEDANTKQDILDKNPDLNLTFSTPEQGQVFRYYGVSPDSENLIITDNTGSRYILDVTNLGLTPLEDEVEIQWFVHSSMNRESRITRGDNRITLDGDLRKTLMERDKNLLPGESFIQGEFIEPLNPGERDLIFIAHTQTIEDKEELQISCLQRDSNSAYEKLWTLSLDGLFFASEDAEDRGPFRKTFSKGNPNYSYQNYVISKDSLYFIYQLHAGQIDLETGELHWMVEL